MQVFTPATHPKEFENNTVLILRDPDGGDKTEGGLYKPQQAVEIANQGEIRAVAADSRYTVGQRIVFVKYAGAQIELNGVEYTLLKEREIQGTIEVIGDPTMSVDEQKDFIQEQLAKLEAEAQKVAGPINNGE